MSPGENAGLEERKRSVDALMGNNTRRLYTNMRQVVLVRRSLREWKRKDMEVTAVLAMTQCSSCDQNDGIVDKLYRNSTDAI